MPENTIIVFPALALFHFLALLAFASQSSRYKILSAFVIIFLFSLMLGLRDPSHFADAASYLGMYHRSRLLSSALQMYHGDYAFSLIMFFANSLTLDFSHFLLILNLLQGLFIFLGLRFLFYKNENCLVLCTLLFAFSSTIALGMTNILRQGLAEGLLVLAVGLAARQNQKKAFLTKIGAFFSHRSSTFPVLLYAVFTPRHKIYLGLYCLVGAIILQLSGFYDFLIALDISSLTSKLTRFNDQPLPRLVIKQILAVFMLILGLWLYHYRRSSWLREILFVKLLFFSAEILMIHQTDLIVSRLHYYSSLMDTILAAGIATFFFHEKKVATVIATVGLFYGIFVYLHPSVQAQLTY